MLIYQSLTESNTAEENRAEDGRETSHASPVQDIFQCQDESDLKTVLDESASGNVNDSISPDDSSLDGNDLPKSRPMSPLTLALRCDEQDTMFMAADSPNGLANHVHSSSSRLREQSTSEVYAEQERIVLAKFRDCLNRLITFGELKGESLSFRSRSVVKHLQ